MLRRISVEPALPGRVCFFLFFFLVKSCGSQTLLSVNLLSANLYSYQQLCAKQLIPSWLEEAAVLDGFGWEQSCLTSQQGVAATAQKPLKVQNSLQYTLPIFSYCEMSLKALKLARHEKSSALTSSARSALQKVCPETNRPRNQPSVMSQRRLSLSPYCLI